MHHYLRTIALDVVTTVIHPHVLRVREVGGDLILHAACDVTEWRTVRALYIVELRANGEGWVVLPKFPVWPDELPAAKLETLAVVDYTGSGRMLKMRG